MDGGVTRTRGLAMTRERTTTWDDPAISAAQVGREPGLSLLERRVGRLPAPPISRPWA